MKAAVMRELDVPLEIEDVQVDKPAAREVLVRTAACGVCHSDLHLLEGHIPTPVPCVLGHEPAGVVEAVGSDVRDFKAGDHVIACLSVFCGSCEMCTSGRPYMCSGDTCRRQPGDGSRLRLGQEPLEVMADLGAFAEQMLVHENALVKVRDEIPLDRAALIGCGVTTGLGAVLNTAQVRPGDTVSVTGCGGVGLSAIQGARIAGASRIVAIDNQEWKLELAQKLGATDAVISDGDTARNVKSLTSGGVDYAFECIGIPELITQCIRMTRDCGTTVMVGVVPRGVNVEVPGINMTLQEKKLIGSIMGSARFRTDMPYFVDLYLNGSLLLDEMISARIPLEDVNSAFDEMRKGSVARSVITFDV